MEEGRRRGGGGATGGGGWPVQGGREEGRHEEGRPTGEEGPRGEGDQCRMRGGGQIEGLRDSICECERVSE